MKSFKTKIYGILYTFFVTMVFSFLFVNLAVAAEYCVGTAVDLQLALDEAQINGEEDTIKLRQGTYTGNFIYDATIEDETYSLTFLGGYKPKPPGCKKRVVDPANTVLDGDGIGRVLTLDCTGVAADLVVDGLTLQNGSSSGGGLRIIFDGGNANISNCSISNNISGSLGGGFHVSEGNVNISNCNIDFNDGVEGGGGSIIGGTFTMSNTAVMNNDSQSGGGGLRILNCEQISLIDVECHNKGI
jgi:hypothetical protein